LHAALQGNVKVCGDCGHSKDISLFSQGDGPDGLAVNCRACEEAAANLATPAEDQEGTAPSTVRQRALCLICCLLEQEQE
jgi:hypothetical protein